jgi:cysteine desulfurase
MNPVVYLDNNATTRVAPEVAEAMLPYLTEFYGNPSSMHSFGGQVGLQLKKARADVAAALGCDPLELIFTSCGSESDNTAILSALAAQPEKKHLVTTRVEHPAVLSLAKHLEEKGYEVTYLGVDDKGNLDMAEVAGAVRKDTAIVSVMYANNETGVIFPIPEIAALCKARGVLFHTDAVQAVGKIDIDLAKLPVDMLSLSGHKLHAPKGVGVLYVRKGTPFRPFLIGGHQERGRRAGTENTAGIIALAAAMTLAKEHMAEENTRVKALRDRLEAGILAAVPHSQVNGDTVNRLPNTTSIAFKFVEGEAILLMLDQYGICASSGSACTSGSLEPSHVLRAMGVPFTYAHGSIRFSLSRYTTDADIDLVLDKLPGIIETLRRMSPFREEEAAKPACTC